MFANAKRKQQYRRFDSFSVRNSVLIISHITFRYCRMHIFQTTFLEIAVWNCPLESRPHFLCLLTGAQCGKGLLVCMGESKLDASHQIRVDSNIMDSECGFSVSWFMWMWPACTCINKVLLDTTHQHLVQAALFNMKLLSLLLNN